LIDLADSLAKLAHRVHDSAYPDAGRTSHMFISVQVQIFLLFARNFIADATKGAVRE
jgi:hypothetical protein